MMDRYTVKDLRKAIRNLPDDTIVCCQSDEEGNRTMVCMSADAEKVGRKVTETFRGQSYTFTEGEDIEGIDLVKDNGKLILVIRPMY